MTEYEMERVIDKTVERTLTRMGFDISDPIACQADMHFLRSARAITGKAGTRAVIVLVGVMTIAAVGGAAAMIARAVGRAITSS